MDMRENTPDGKVNEDGLDDSHEAPPEVLAKVESLVLLPVDVKLRDSKKGLRAQVLLEDTGNNDAQRREKGVENCKTGGFVLERRISIFRGPAPD